MVAPPLVILRVATVAPAPVPALRPTLYGVVLVHCTWRVDDWSTLPVRTPWLPKLRVEALTIVHDAVMVICTVKVVVVVAAYAPPMNTRKVPANTAHVTSR